MVIDHVGIIVQSLEVGIKQWEELFGYRQTSAVVTNTRQKVSVVFLSRPNSIVVKLVEPSEPDSPVAAYARKGGGLHHLCFRCDNLEAEIPLLKAKGARFIVPPQPGEAFGNRPIAFFLAGNGLNVELIDTDHKEGWKE